MDKKLIKYVGILVGVLLIIIVFLIIINSIKGTAKYSYDSIENKMVRAAKKYVEDKQKQNLDVLPSSLGESFPLSSDVLVNEGYLSDLSSYAKDDTVCVGNVNIVNVGNNLYDYVPELTCGDYYKSERLVDVVIKDNDYGVVNGSGLYQKIDGKFVTNEMDLNGSGSDFEYVFRGDEVNNYIQIDDNIWRIVAIDDSDNMLLIFNSAVQQAKTWDDKYNEQANKYYGVNIYEENGLESNAYKEVQSFFKGESIIYNREKYSEKTKYLIVPMDLCIGGRKETDSDYSGKIECQKILEEQQAGLLPAYYFMSASLDSSCTSTTSKSCGNFNYLTQFNDYWWLLTPNSATTSEVFSVSNKFIESNTCSFKSSIRPTIKIGSRAIYQEGDGSLNNPYKIKSYID